jgi:plasmid stabilization system protein ParE
MDPLPLDIRIRLAELSATERQGAAARHRVVRSARAGQPSVISHPTLGAHTRVAGLLATVRTGRRTLTATPQPCP